MVSGAQRWCPLAKRCSCSCDRTCILSTPRIEARCALKAGPDPTHFITRSWTCRWAQPQTTAPTGYGAADATWWVQKLTPPCFQNHAGPHTSKLHSPSGALEIATSGAPSVAFAFPMWRILHILFP